MWIFNENQTDLINLDKVTALFVRDSCLYAAIAGLDNQALYNFQSEEEAQDALMQVATRIGRFEYFKVVKK